jgi:hypothetical protein
MTILRAKKELQVKVKTSPVSGDGTSRVVFWAGAALHGTVFFQSMMKQQSILIFS